MGDAESVALFHDKICDLLVESYKNETSNAIEEQAKYFGVNVKLSIESSKTQNISETEAVDPTAKTADVENPHDSEIETGAVAEINESEQKDDFQDGPHSNESENTETIESKSKTADKSEIIKQKDNVHKDQAKSEKRRSKKSKYTVTEVVDRKDTIALNDNKLKLVIKRVSKGNESNQQQSTQLQSNETGLAKKHQVKKVNPSRRSPRFTVMNATSNSTDTIPVKKSKLSSSSTSINSDLSKSSTSTSFVSEENPYNI